MRRSHSAFTAILGILLAGLVPGVWGQDQIFSVTNSNDSGLGSLRQAVLDANAASPGSNHQIVLNPGLSPISLSKQLFVNSNVVFVGNNNTISGNNTDRIFFVAGGTVEFRDLTLREGLANGGRGGSGNLLGVGAGGGGAGLGGAIFVANGAGIPRSNVTLTTSVTVRNVSFFANTARGGDGGSKSAFPTLFVAGGGGGMGGNGGNSNNYADGAGGGGFGNSARGGEIGPSDTRRGDFVGAENLDGGGGGGGRYDIFFAQGGGGGGIRGPRLIPENFGTDGGFGGGGGGGTGGGDGGFGGGGGGTWSTGDGAEPGDGGFGGGGGGGRFDARQSEGKALGGFGGGSSWGGGPDNSTAGGGGGGLGAGGAVFVMAGAEFRVVQADFTINSVFGGQAGGSKATNGQAMGSDFFLGGRTVFEIPDGITTTIGGDIAGGDDPQARGGIEKSGPGTLQLSGVNSYVGGTRVTGGILSAQSASALGSGKIEVVGGGKLQSSFTLNRNGVVTASGAGSLISTDDGLAIGSTANGTLTVSNGATVRAATSAAFGVLNPGGAGEGSISGEGSHLEVGGLLTVGYENTGILRVNAGGTITAGRVALGQRFGGSGVLEIGSGGTVNIGGENGIISGEGVHSLALGGGTLKVTGSSLTTSVQTSLSGSSQIDTNGLNATFSGTISGNGALVKSGNGTLVLTGQNTYSGQTSVSQGTLQIGGGGSTGSVLGGIENNATVEFRRSDDYTFEGVISGSGGLIHSGSILRLTSAQTYAGPTSVNGQVLVLPTVVDFGLAASSVVTLGPDSVLDLSNRQQRLAGLTGSGTIYSFGGNSGSLRLEVGASQSHEFSGNIGGNLPHFSLTKEGSGVQILSGNNTFTGNTTVSAGTLIISGSLGTGRVEVGPEGALGGDGILHGSLHFADDADLIFEPLQTLFVHGATVTFAGFGIPNVIGLNASTAPGTYTLLDGPAAFDFTNVANLGLNNAYDLGGGKLAYFEEGSLQLVVVPEASSVVLLALGIGAVAWIRCRAERLSPMRRKQAPHV